MKTNIPQWILDCVDNHNPGRCAEAVEALLAIIERLESGKPDWKDAPEWSEWLAQDADGSWWWYSEKPSTQSTRWNQATGQPLQHSAMTQSIGWKVTLEKRPTNETT